MPELADGASAEVQGTTSWYTISRRGNTYSCTCPAWLHQRLPVEQRSCKHIRSYLGGYALSATAPLPGAPEYEEAEDVRRRREEILATALDRYVVLYDKMEESFGLRMPEQLAYMAGFFLALLPEERDIITDGPGLLGVATWFAEESPAPSGDERLRDRKSNDPPELIAVLSGKQGARYGLWYDEPKELPTATAIRGADRFATTEVFDTTVLRTVFDALLETRTRDPYGMIPSPEPRPLEREELSLLSWLAEVARRELTAARGPTIPRRAGVCHAGITPFVTRGWTAPQDLSGYLEYQERFRAYQEHDPVVTSWVAQALAEIKDAAPGRALVLGQELNWLDTSDYRESASELLVRGYASLGRRALADILRAQYIHFDPSAKVFELPPPHAVINAAAMGDAEELARALAEGAPPNEEEIAEALSNATTEEAVSALLEIDATQTDNALWRRLVELARPVQDDAQKKSTRAIVHLFVTRGMVNARAYGKLLEIGDEELIDLATTRVEIFSEDARGKTALHFAAEAAHPKAVRALLDRGADAASEDSAGKVAYEGARKAWRKHPREAGEIFAMLEAAGGGPKTRAKTVETPELEVARDALAHKPPPPPVDDFEWTDGIEVHHARFGDGVVEEVLGGEGDETKLKIRFENETRSLLAKFVKRT